MTTPAIPHPLGEALSGALAAGQFEPHFQPKVNLKTGQVVGVEALVRWRHPEQGLLDPSAFLDLVSGNQMRELTEQMIASSIRAAGDWWRSGLGLRVSINLPAEAFTGGDWRLEVAAAEALNRANLPGDALGFEIGQEVLLTQPEMTADLLERLRVHDSTIVLHQFSADIASIESLSGLPLEELKIGRGTVRTLFDQGGTASIREIVSIAKALGLRTAAEGIESRETWRRLRSVGCAHAQGFLISRPLPGREIPRWLAGWGRQARRLRLITVRRRPRKARAGAPARRAA